MMSVSSTVIVLLSGTNTSSLSQTNGSVSANSLEQQPSNGNFTREPMLASDWWFDELVVTPNLTLAREQLRWTLLLHTYGFAVLFFMLAFYGFFSFLHLRAQLSSQPFMSSINVFLCLLGITRASAFLIDPYNSKQILPKTIGAINWDLAFPCLLSAFTLIQLAFLQLTQLRIGPAKLRSKSCLSLVISTHFCLIIASDILWAFRDAFKVMRYIIQTVFACWGSFICVVFLHGGWRTMQLLKNVPPVLFCHSDSSQAGYDNKGMKQLGLLAKCNNLASMAATAAAPAFLLPPKIRITDENDQTYSYVSDTIHPNNQNIEDQVEKTDEASPLPTPKKTTGNIEEEVEEGVKEQTWMLEQYQESKEMASQSPATIYKGSSSKPLPNGLTGKKRANPKRTNQVEMSLLSGITEEKEKKTEKINMTSILNHIAYVDQAMDDFKITSRKRKAARSSQIQKVLHSTYSAAALGFLVCLLEIFGIFGPYGICAASQPPEPWPWFIYQSLYRLAEVLMGCIMANITKQPVNRHHFPYSYRLHQREGVCY